MESAQQLAARVREVLLNGKWIANTNYQHTLNEISLDEALKKVSSLNTIAALTFHVNYYVAGVLNVLKGGQLEISDKFSFDFDPPKTEEEWAAMKSNFAENAEKFVAAVERLSESQLEQAFVDERYGSYRRNIEGLIEHSYYHLGQISLIRKMLND